MGVLNVTPDSFSDGGQYKTPQHALNHARLMQKQGADILDIGGESSRPNAQKVSLEEELNRVMPVIELVSKEVDLPLCVDTTKPQVMQAAIEAGVSIINDISALSNKKTQQIACNSGATICLMHMQNNPQTMQNNPQYNDILAEVLDFFTKKIKHCQALGIDKNRLIIDPGFGFGKTLQHNLTLLNNVSAFKVFNLPILVGLSRKSMIGALLGGQTKPHERVIGSIVASITALNQGADIIRTHDVAQTSEALRVWYHSQIR